MKHFLRYTLTLVAILIATTNAWAQAQNLQYQWVTRFDNTITFDNADLQKITNGTYVEHVKFTITDVSYYHDNKLIGDDVDRLDYTTYKDANEHQSTWSWEVETNHQNPYRVTVTDIKCQVRGKNSDDNQPAYAWFNSNSKVDCKTKSGDEGGSKEVGISNANGLGNSVIFKRQGYYKNSSFSNWAEDYVTFTLHNIRYTCKVEQQVPDFQYKAIAETNNSEYGSAYSSWSSFANATTSESTHTKYDPNTLSTTPGIAQTVYFKAVPKTGYNFVGWKKSLDATTYESYDMEYSLDFTSTSNDKDKPSTITLYAVFNAQKDPRFDIQTTAAVEVGKTIYPTFTFDDVANAPTSDTSKKFHFIITHTPDATTKEGSDDPSKVISYNPTDNSITGLNSGTAKITFIHEETNDYFGQTQECVVTVSKQQTSLSLNLQETYFVDDEDNTVYTTNHSDVTVLVSDKTSDNRALFTYSNGILKANGATLNANSETTTITVTQPETYKWTGKTLTKEVLVKKHPSDFSWLLKDTYYVDDVITSIFSKAANNLPTTITSSDPNIVKVEGNQLIALNAGEVTITATQDVDRKWVAFTQTKKVTILKHNIVATITPDNAFWNELVPNPFAATSTHPVTKQVTKIDNFKVEQQSNEHIALMDANTRNIQTYFNDGTVKFRVSRQEDYKYNELLEELELIVEYDKNGCYAFNDDTKAFNLTKNSKTSQSIQLNGVGNILTFYYKINSGTDWVQYDHHVTTQYSTDGTNFNDISNSRVSTNTKTNTKSHEIQVPQTAKYIRFVWSANGTGGRDIYVSNITVTRAQYIRPTDAGQPLNSTNALVLPPVAINLPRSKPFNLEWSACSDIKITCDNPKFTISTTDISAVSGSQNITITCNTSEIGTFIGDVTIYNQEQKETFPVICEVYTKWLTDSISGSATHSMKVDEPWNTDFYFPIQRASQYPTTDGAFHYAIKHTFVDENPADRNPNNPNEVISYNNGVITAHNAGTAILTIKHDETPEHFASQQFTCTLTVSKHDAELQWKDPVYFNDTIYNYFTTTNTISPIVIESQTDTDVAKLTNEFNPTSNNSLDLITFNKEASTTVTVSQVENYKWNGYSTPHTITPIDPNNHVTFTIDSEAKMNIFHTSHSSNSSMSWSNSSIQIGDGGDGLEYGKELIIRFTGIPKDLSFSYNIANDGTTRESWKVYESEDGQTWSDAIWTADGENGTCSKQPLKPDTRFLKFYYGGNFGCYFKNIHVTELNEFRAVDQNNDTQDVTHLDFGANQVFTSKTLPFKLRYANPGYKITVESTDPHFTVDPSYIGDIGGEYHGTRTINVTYTSSEPYATSSNAMIIIKDEIGKEHSDTVYLSASSYKAEQVIHWRDDFEAIPTPIIRLNNGNITDAAWATSHLPVTYTSSNEAVIKISDDGKTLIPIAEGEAEITAYQLGNETWLPADDTTKTFIVTEKLLQYIIWDDDLTNIIKEDINPQTLPLTAQVYLQQEDGTVVFSQEQTNNLKYQSGNDNIVSAVSSTLTIHNVGNTTLTATVEGNNDYATASMTKTVIVRSATPGCDDNLLYHHEGDPIQFFQYNMDEIIKEPIALDRSKGEAGYVVVSHYGQSWNLAIQYYAAEIRVEQSLDNANTWSTLETIRPVKNQENFDTIPLNRQATHIRFVRNDGGQGYQFLYNIDVHPAQYIEAQNVVNFGEIHIGSRETRTFPLHYSNIKHSLSPVPSTSEVTATPNTFGECSGFGTQDINVTWLPTQVSDNATATITFTDPNSGMEKIVTLVAKVTKGTQTINWDNIPNIIEDCGSILFPEKTTANLPITWTVVEGKEFADFNEHGILEIYKNGTIVVEATQEGTANYEPLTPIRYEFEIQIHTIFVGTEDSNWDNPNNWTMCRLPYPTEVVTIEQPATISTHTTVAGVIISTNGVIHITSTGGLTVGAQGIQGAASDGSSIIIDNLKTGAGFLRISPEYQGTMPRATVNYQTRSTLDSGANQNATWQYIGAPGANCQFTVDGITWFYQWSEPQNWINKTGTLTLEPFAGYAITQYGKPTYALSAEAITSDQTITLTKTESGMNGNNLFANSYMAPIDAKNFTPEDFSDYNTGREDIVKTFYIFNSGSWNDWNKYNTEQSKGSNGNDVPGQYCAVPAFSSKYMDGAEITTLPPMQGIYVIANADGAQIHLNYDKHVWKAGTNPDVTTDMHEPMRSPQRMQAQEQMQQDSFRRIRLQLNSANSGADRLYVIQTDETTPLYDNGYDAPNQTVDGLTNIYTTESFGKMEVSCSNHIDSMYIGFQAGSDTQYTLSFSSLIGDMLYLQDLEQDTIVAMQQDMPYTFSATPLTINDHRFRLLLYPEDYSDTSNTPTDTDPADNIRVWVNNNILHIIGAPANSTLHIYNISGAHIFTQIISDTPYTYNLSHLSASVYLVRINNYTYKVITK